jgi:AcrR family transcriptional regulator
MHVMNDSSTGLRERKRAQTSEAIHLAATELALERGLDETRIDAISDRAGVSTRTFFNYFSSKEDAILGIDEAAVASELESAGDGGDDALRAVFDLIYALFEASGGTRKRSELKRRVMREYPQLMTRQMIRVADLEDRLTAIIAGWLARDERFAAGSDDDRAEESRIILAICLATVRVSMRRWASESDAEPAQIYERAIATLRTVLEKLR